MFFFFRDHCIGKKKEKKQIQVEMLGIPPTQELRPRVSGPLSVRRRDSPAIDSGPAGHKPGPSSAMWGRLVYWVCLVWFTQKSNTLPKKGGLKNTSSCGFGAFFEPT